MNVTFSVDDGACVDAIVAGDRSADVAVESMMMMVEVEVAIADRNPAPMVVVADAAAAAAEHYQPDAIALYARCCYRAFRYRNRCQPSMIGDPILRAEFHPCGRAPAHHPHRRAHHHRTHWRTTTTSGMGCNIHRIHRPKPMARDPRKQWTLLYRCCCCCCCW